jgi:hypothetical protein
VRVEVVVVGTGDPGRDAGEQVCRCARAFGVDEQNPFPIIAEFGRGHLYDSASIRVEWFDGDVLCGRQYVRQAWPASGVVEVPAIMSRRCPSDFCVGESHCTDGGCACTGAECVYWELAQALVDDSWVDAVLCSGEGCDLLDADARVDADGGEDGAADARADADGGEDVVGEVDGGDAGDEGPDAGG